MMTNVSRAWRPIRILFLRVEKVAPGQERDLPEITQLVRRLARADK